MLNFLAAIAGNGGGGGGSFESIATQTLTGTSSSITFSSIPSTYQHLQLRILAGDASSASNTFGIILNGDTGSNYAAHGLRGNGSTVSVNAYSSQTRMVFFELGGTTNWGVGIIDFHDYASTSKNKTIRTFVGNDRNGSGTVAIGSGLWMSTNAVNSLTIDNMTFGIGSTFALYGIKGA